MSLVIKEVANAVEAAENLPPVVETESGIALYQVQSMSKYHDTLRDVVPFKNQAVTNRRCKIS